MHATIITYFVSLFYSLIIRACRFVSWEFTAPVCSSYHRVIRDLKERYFIPDVYLGLFYCVYVIC